MAIILCHAEGGATKGGVSKCEQTQTNADKRKQVQRRKRKQTQANASERGQTQTNAYTPLCCCFFTPPFAIPLIILCLEKRSGDPDPQYFSKSIAVQMGGGGVLPYKWEAYCSTNGRRIAGLPFVRSLEARKVRRYKWGGVLPYKLEVYCRTFQTSCRGWGFRNIGHHLESCVWKQKGSPVPNSGSAQHMNFGHSHLPGKSSLNADFQKSQEKTVQISRKSSKLGGGNASLWTKQFYAHPDVSESWDPQNEFSGIPWIGLFLGIPVFFIRTP